MLHLLTYSERICSVHKLETIIHAPVQLEDTQVQSAVVSQQNKLEELVINAPGPRVTPCGSGCTFCAHVRAPQSAVASIEKQLKGRSETARDVWIPFAIRKFGNAIRPKLMLFTS